MNNSPLNPLPAYYVCSNSYGNSYEATKSPCLHQFKWLYGEFWKEVENWDLEWDIRQEYKPNVPSSFINFLNKVIPDYQQL